MSLQSLYSTLRCMKHDMPNPHLSIRTEDGAPQLVMVNGGNPNHPHAIPMTLLEKHVEMQRNEFGKGSEIPFIQLKNGQLNETGLLDFTITWPTEKVAETAEDSVGC